MSDALLFFRTFLANPFAIGSVIPSSKHLVADLLDGIDFTTARTVVEYGPGTGVFTDEILRRLAPDAKLLCIEIMDDFYNTLSARYDDPRLVLVHGSAADVERLLAEHGLGQADAVVSGLPFTSLPEEVRHAILGGTARALKPEGRFVMYQYSQFVMGHIKKYFAAIQTRFTMLNVPPAFSFYCDAPIVSAPTPEASPSRS
ncbi:MAG: pmtA [Cyanobacteria bacterium RYN_339]|nr:pmtA [Cyanobacteria bacterium RYN_339]